MSTTAPASRSAGSVVVPESPPLTPPEPWRRSSPDVLVALLVFLVYTRVTASASERFGLPSPLQPLVAATFVWVWWRTHGSATAGAAVRTFGLAIGVFGIAALPGLFRPDPSSTVEMLTILGRDTLFVASLIYIVVARRSVEAAAWGMIAALALLSLTTLVHAAGFDVGDGFWGMARTSEQLITEVDEGDRATGPYDDPNFFAQALVILIAPALERARRAPSLRWRVVAGSVALVGLAAIAATYSRGGLFAIVLVVGYQLWRDPPSMRRFVGVAGVVVLATIALAPSSLLDRVTSVESALPSRAVDSDDVSIRGRASEAIAAFDMFEANPMTGVGLGSYDERYVEFSSKIGLDPRREDRAAHNLYLEIAAEMGLLGLSAAVVSALVIWRASRARVIDRIGSAQERSLAIGLRASVLGFAGTAVFLHDIHPRPWMLALGLAVAAGQLPLARLSAPTPETSP
jgi:putative inorganic carbon (hco3(-)) transporter